VLELERGSKREKRRGKKWVSVEGGKEREKRNRESRKGEGIFWKQKMTSTLDSSTHDTFLTILEDSSLLVEPKGRLPLDG
jgi:hypothetical protein